MKESLIEETLMMTMMMIRSKENLRYESSFKVPINTSTCPTWKLYENPYYNSQLLQHKQQHIHHPQQEEEDDLNHKYIHHIHLPISARKIASSFWDLTFIKPIMESELDLARAQINELKANLEYERKARKKLESTNKRLLKELFEQKRGREAVDRVCEELVKEISSDKAEISRLKLEMQEERKMLRIAEVLREERVQMKLAEAKVMLEEKFLELEATKQMQIEPSVSSVKSKNQEENVLQITNVSRNLSGETSRFRNDEDGGDYEKSDRNEMVQWMQRRASREAENPHIRRGIKGFVEFPKVVRAIGSKSRQLGTKLECQKSQLMILLKQKTAVGSNNLILS